MSLAIASTAMSVTAEHAVSDMETILDAMSKKPASRTAELSTSMAVPPVTADRLEALRPEDFRLGGLTPGEVFAAGSSELSATGRDELRGGYILYEVREESADRERETADANDANDVSERVFGPDATTDLNAGASRKGDASTTNKSKPNAERALHEPLRDRYVLYASPTVPDGAPIVTRVDISSEDYKTSRDIGIGNTRGEILYMYGVPKSIFRLPERDGLLFVYTDEAGERSLSFFIEKGKAVRMVSTDARSNPGRFREMSEARLHPGVLADADFSLAGYRINDEFNGAPDDGWVTRGEIYGSDFIGYPNYLVSYDKRNLIDRVLLAGTSAVTRRGLTIGDTKYLMLYLYGEPSTAESGGEEEVAKLKVYTYHHPDGLHSYLMCIVNEEDGFIESIILSDRPYARLRR